MRPLCLGKLEIPGYAVKKSGIVWLLPDHAVCEKNQIFGFCNISLEPISPAAPRPFENETILQAALAAPAAGRLRADPETSFGGYLNFLGVQLWDPHSIIGFLETDDGQPGGRLPVRLCMLAGKLFTRLADYGTGLLPGWHSHARAWRPELADVPATLLSLGICDARGPLLGDDASFLEFFAEAESPCHILVAGNDLLVPSALCLLEQFERDDTAYNLIARELEQAVFNGPIKPTPQDHFFAGALLEALRASPIRETHDIITGAGLQKTSPPAAIILSANAEPMRILRHKILAYHLHLHHFQLAAAGPAIRAWLQTAFEPAPRGIAGIKHDYETLITAVQAQFETKFIVLNRMSSSGREDLAFYAPFDAPLSQTLVHVAAKEINLMLHDLAAAGKITIIDIDALAAELGGAQHLPDGTHQSGELQSRIRGEILRLMA